MLKRERIGLLTVSLVVAMFAGCGSSVQPRPSPDGPGRLSTVSGGPVPLTVRRTVTLIRYEGIYRGSVAKRIADTNVNDLYHAMGVTLAARGMAWQYVPRGEPAAVRGQVLGAFQRAAATWNAVVPGSGLFAVSTGGLGMVTQDGVNSIGWSTQWSQGWPAAEIVLYAQDNLVVEADVLLNAKLTWAVSAPIAPGENRTGLLEAWDVQSLATHELGHALGLDDISRDNGRSGSCDSTMFCELQKGELVPQTLTPGDTAGAEALAPAPGQP